MIDDNAANAIEFYLIQNGYVDMKRRVHAIRFGRLSSPELFRTATLVGSEVVWDDGTCSVRASINELLDSMQMD